MTLGVYGFITRFRDVKNALDTLKTLLHITAVPQDIDGESRRADSRYCLFDLIKADTDLNCPIAPIIIEQDVINNNTSTLFVGYMVEAYQVQGKWLCPPAYSHSPCHSNHTDTD
jgi:hypothetical protein